MARKDNQQVESQKQELNQDAIQEEEVESNERELSGWIRYVFLAIAVIGALYHIIVLNFAPQDPWVFRSTHLVFGLVLGLLLFPGWGSKKNKIHIIDWILILVSIYIGYYIYANLDQLLFRMGVAPTDMDVYVSIAGILIIIELTRRTSGWVLPILAGVFVAYAYLGPYLPGILQHQGYSVERFVTYIFGLDGVFGVTLDVSSKYIVLFIIFGAFLQISKVGQYFIDVAFAIAGGMRGGPAKVSVFSSGLMGMMNGTSAGNAVATGSLTIPLMKKVGYTPRFAAATEATASAGGQLLPPIMGAGAFIMAEILGVKYSEIILAALIPAILYFVSVYFMIDFEALKRGMKGLSRDKLPKFKDIAKQSYLILPIILLITMLVNGYSIILSGTVGIVSSLVASWFSKSTRMGIKKTALALELGMKQSIQLIAVIATAGIIVGVIALTGVGMRFSSMLLAIADSNVLLALIFAMLLSIILGMGMPTTAAYAIAASVVAPGLIKIGIDPLVAHMFVFYYAVISAITPPVALASYAASGIAGTDPMRTAFTSFKLGLAAYIVPFMFFYSPELLMTSETGLEIILVTITALIGVYLLAAAAQGWFYKAYAGWLVRSMLFVAAISLIYVNYMLDFVALVLVLVAGFIQWKIGHNSSEEKAG
ncbi:TRAP transporter permease [Piscibacillus halophilus]|uniref:TRAP transporter, 4TM/12TM fusion protein n=2 Tax=Piscibacillus halophilus TaxID=571933 RepID=A0A1H9HQ58_9BACI|nr:TRAP transporter permease [Piscibacillus halophilus]SEQ64362.1 TRAP transporter, 4TM/12TM fusion protein [Piscibacillus halophilus]